MFIRDWNQLVILPGQGNIGTSQFYNSLYKQAHYIDTPVYSNADAGELLRKESCASVPKPEVILLQDNKKDSRTL